MIHKYQEIDISGAKDLKKHDILFEIRDKDGMVQQKCRVLIPMTKKKKPNMIMRFEGQEYTMPVVTFDLLVRFGLNKIKREVYD